MESPPFPIHCTPSPTLRKLPCFGWPGLWFTSGFVQQQPPLSQFMLHSPSAKKLHKKTRPGQDQRVPEMLPPSLIHGGCQESFANGINLNVVDENHLKESSQDKQESWSFPPPWGRSGFPSFCFYASTFPSRRRQVPCWKPVQMMVMSPDLTNPAFPPLPPECLFPVFPLLLGLIAVFDTV